MSTVANIVASVLKGEPIIPPMTDPLSKHWDQPKTDLITFSEGYKLAIMDAAAFDALHDYSHSQPSGVYAGKMWKRKSGKKWLLCWFGIDTDPNYCTNNYVEIQITNQEQWG